MNLILKGGKILNKGYKGAVMDLYNEDKSDNKTLYEELLKENPEELKLISLDKEIIVDNSELEFILNEIKKNSKTTLAKKFLFGNILFGSNKKNFHNELTGYKDLAKIFKKDISKYTTIKKGFSYKKNDIYGIIFNKHFYIFLEKCYKTLDKIDFTEKSLNKCIKEITEVLEILREHKYIHNDIKPDNIILCKNRFKLIDWESSNYIKDQASTFVNSKNGNLVFNHPIKFYKIGMPFIMYKYIYNAELITYKFLKKIKMPELITKEVENTFNKVVETYKKNKDFYLEIADSYSFAISIIYLAEINKISNYNKQFINETLANYSISL
jgi:serine/threonine protein kinase